MGPFGGNAELELGYIGETLRLCSGQSRGNPFDSLKVAQGHRRDCTPSARQHLKKLWRDDETVRHSE